MAVERLDRNELYQEAADRIGCDASLLRALARVESGERFRDSEGRAIRRFEPHLMWPDDWHWRQSLKVSRSKRLELERQALDEDAERARRSSSMGAFQVLGRWFEQSGFPNAVAMYETLSGSPVAQVQSAVDFIEANGLAGAFRAGDLEAIAVGWNGSGQPGVYARKLRAALSDVGGHGETAVVSRGDAGPSVRRVQRLVGVDVDGEFGPSTHAAVMEAQRDAGVKVDGIVGQKTWAALASSRDGEDAQREDRRASTLLSMERASKIVSVASGGAAAVRDSAPYWAVHVGWVLALVAATAAALFVAYRMWTGNAGTWWKGNS